MKHIVLSQDFFPMIGGAHSWLYEVYRRWPAPVTWLTSNASNAAAAAEFDRLDHGSLAIHRDDIRIENIDLLSRDCRRRFAYVSRKLRELAAGESATVHCLRAFPEGFAALLAKMRRPRSLRLVVYAHGEETLVARSSRQLLYMSKLTYRAADVVIANSQNTQRLVQELSPGANVICVHPGVDVAAFQRPTEQLAAFRRRWPWTEETVVIATVARMEPRKNQASVLNAVAQLLREGLSVAYVCAGDGEERSRLQALARSLGVESRVHFPGVLSTEDKILTFGACDIHAMPSIRAGQMIEGFGIVFLEAAAAGKASICGVVGGQAEAVLDRETGLAVDGTDSVAVTDALRRLVSSRAERETMGRAALVHAASHDWSVLVPGTIDAIRRAAER